VTLFCNVAPDILPILQDSAGADLQWSRFLAILVLTAAGVIAALTLLLFAAWKDPVAYLLVSTNEQIAIAIDPNGQDYQNTAIN